jgi:hypothetical protein
MHLAVILIMRDADKAVRRKHSGHKKDQTRYSPLLRCLGCETASCERLRHAKNIISTSYVEKAKFNDAH